MEAISRKHMTKTQLAELAKYEKRDNISTEIVVESSKQVKPKRIPNPTGKGGFQDHPELRSNGHWDSKNVFSFQVRRFLNMTAQEFKDYSATPPDQMTMAELIAYHRVARGKDLNEYKDMADRLQGKAAQSVDVTTDGMPLQINTVNFINANTDDPL